MFDVIDVLVASIILNALLYLNLPPNLFKSVYCEYVVNELIICDCKLLTDPT